MASTSVTSVKYDVTVAIISSSQANDHMSGGDHQVESGNVMLDSSMVHSLKIGPWSIVIVFFSIFLLFVHGQEEAIIIEVCPVPLLLGVPGVALLQPELERGARHLEALARLLVPEEAGVGAVVPGVPSWVALHCTAQGQ